MGNLPKFDIDVAADHTGSGPQENIIKPVGYCGTLFFFL